MLRKQFLFCVLPAMLAFAFSGVYAIVDGWFIGRNVGDMGLAAVNIAYPLTALIQAVGTGIGMGGAIHLGISIGRGDEEAQRGYMGGVMTALALACIVTTAVLGVAFTPLLRLFGASGDMLEYAVSYSRLIVLGAVLQIFGTGLIPVIRNYGGSLAAMLAMVAGFTTNVALDWLFVSILGYGMAGAAAATLIGQAVTMLPCVLFLIAKGRLLHFCTLKSPGRTIKEIGAVALSPFGLTLSPNIIIIILNKGALAYGGQEAAACYAVISYVVCIVQLLLQGIGDGAQPLVSKLFGLREYSSIRTVRRLSYAFAFGVAAVCIAVMALLREEIPLFFGVSASVAAAISNTLPIFMLGFFFVSFLRITTSFFYAIKKNRRATLLIYGEPVLLAVLVLFILPPLQGLQGVWFCVPLAQLCLTAAGILLLRTVKEDPAAAPLSAAAQD